MDNQTIFKIHSLSKEETIDVLLHGTIDLQGQFALGSNYTFLVRLDYQSKSFNAVYKPLKGEMPLWDFPPESLAAREAAAFALSEALQWDLVPPTVIRENAPFGKGSMQLFIPHDPDMHYFSFDQSVRSQLRNTVIFDLLINNADRKGSHIILDKSGHIWLIDHGLCFHTTSKLRTVICDFSGESISKVKIGQLKKLLDALKQKSKFYSELSHLLNKKEIEALKSRILFIINHPVFPEPDQNKRQFPWPLV